GDVLGRRQCPRPGRRSSGQREPRRRGLRPCRRPLGGAAGRAAHPPGRGGRRMDRAGVHRVGRRGRREPPRRVRRRRGVHPVAEGYPPETSWGLALPAPIQGIIARRWAPTASIGCSADWRRRALKTGRLAWFSRIHSLAKAPVWISDRIFFISWRVSEVTILGPRVMSPYSAVSEIENRMLEMPPS